MMNNSSIKTKKAHILFADIFSYSMLMEYSEVETHLLSTKAIEFAANIALEWGGYFAQDVAGDGVIFEFEMVENALSSALMIQRELSESPIILSNGELILFKIGINSGDVLFDGDKRIGTVVNVAARIQQLAGAGQIFISGSTYSQLADSSRHAFKEEHVAELKNIKNVDSIYSFKSSGNSTALGRANSGLVRHSYNLKPGVAVVPTKSLMPDDKTLPVSMIFGELLSGNLAKFKDFDVRPPIVITTHTREAAALMRMCRLENIKYLVESTLIPKSKVTFLLSCQLIDTSVERIIWSDSFSFDVGKLKSHLAYFIEICSVRIWASIRHYEDQSSTSIPIGQKEYAAFLNARKLIHSIQKNKLKLGVTLLKSIVKQYPDFKAAHIELAHAYQLAWRYDWEIEKKDQLELSINVAQNVVQEDPFNSAAYRELGYSQLFNKDSKNAIKSMIQAVKLNPLDVMAIANLAEGYVFVNEPKKAIKLTKRSLALDSNIQRDWRLWSLADAYFVAKDYEKVVQTVDSMQDKTQGLRLKAASLANQEKVSEAHLVSKKIMDDNPDFRVSSWRKKQPDSNEDEVDHFCDGLLKAGLPN